MAFALRARVSAGGRCVIGDRSCACGEYSCDSTRSVCVCVCVFDGSTGSSKSCRVPASSEGRCCLKLSSAGVGCECSTLYTTDCSSSMGEYSIESCDETTLLAELGGVERVVDRCSR